MKTSWTLVKLSMAPEADYYYCLHSLIKWNVRGGQRQVQGRFWDQL